MWLQCERIAIALGRRAEAIAMRDTDCGLTSVIFVRSGAGIGNIQDLKGNRVAVGADDSPPSLLVPFGGTSVPLAPRRRASFSGRHHAVEPMLRGG